MPLSPGSVKTAVLVSMRTVWNETRICDENIRIIINLFTGKLWSPVLGLPMTKVGQDELWLWVSFSHSFTICDNYLYKLYFYWCSNVCLVHWLSDFLMFLLASIILV